MLGIAREHVNATWNMEGIMLGGSPQSRYVYGLLPSVGEKSVNWKLEYARFPDIATFPVTQSYG
jgi:hypothetical protein